MTWSGGITLVTPGMRELVSIWGFSPADCKDNTPLVSAYGTSHRPMILFGAFAGHPSFVGGNWGMQVCRSGGAEEKVDVFAPKGDQAISGPVRRDYYIMQVGPLVTYGPG